MKIISRDEARGTGLKRFFTGDPCVHGHLSERFVGNGQCVACRAEKYDPDLMRAYNSNYREANKDSLQKYDRDRYSADPEKKRSAARRYYAENREACISAAKRWRTDNVARDKERRKRYREENRDRMLTHYREFRKKNSKAIAAKVTRWRLLNPEKRKALSGLRRARKMQAVPPWFDELDQFVWQEAADLVRIRRDATGIDWAADHMIPLAGRRARGLHVAGNCQVIPAAMNVRKNNKMILTERLEWLK